MLLRVKYLVWVSLFTPTSSLEGVSIKSLLSLLEAKYSRSLVAPKWTFMSFASWIWGGSIGVQEDNEIMGFWGFLG